jgi:transposase
VKVTHPDVSIKARERNGCYFAIGGMPRPRHGERIMEEITTFVGLHVHKKTNAVATVEGRASADVRFVGTIANTTEAIRSLLRKLGEGGQRLHLAYEAGPLGYNLYPLSTGLGHRCDVVARPSFPGRPAIKSKQINAIMIVTLLRAGQLTEV